MAENPDNRIKAVVAKGADTEGGLSKKEIKELEKFVSQFGAKGLAYFQCRKDDAGRVGLKGPLTKFLETVELDNLMVKCDIEEGDIVFFGAGDKDTVLDYMGRLRLELANKLFEKGKLIKTQWAPLWVTDFPMFEKDDKADRWNALHHPFTAPDVNDIEALKADPGQSLSRAYDMILNGTELGGGSLRIYKRDMQEAVFEILGISDEEANEKFGFLLDALKFGCPPHAGIAFGLDRLVMLMTGAGSIREVMAFPKTQSAACLLTSAPAPVSTHQMNELGIKLKKAPKIEE